MRDFNQLSETPPTVGGVAGKTAGVKGVAPKKSRRGFASMDPQRQREVSRLGGKRAHELGRAHEFTREEAKAAGRKGGLATRRKPVAS